MLHLSGMDGGAMSVDEMITAQPNTCVLLAPQNVEVGKHVTDAVRAGGWTLARTTNALDAMLTLCRLEQAQRDDGRSGHGKHMLLIHRDVAELDIAELTSAVRGHLPAVKVHEIQQQADAPETPESAVVGRIGRAISAASIASKAMERSGFHHDGDEEETDERDEAMAPQHDVTRDEIAMLLSDETGLEPRASRGEQPPFPGAGVGDAR